MNQTRALEGANIRISIKTSGGREVSHEFNSSWDPKTTILDAISELSGLAQLYGFSDEARSLASSAMAQVKAWEESK